MENIETEEKFNEIIQSDKPVIVKFLADWCPDCKRMDMFIGEVMEEFNNHDWYQINSDEVKGIAQKYEVMGIPSILVFQNGEKIAHQHSADTKSPEAVSGFLHKQLA